MPNKRVQYNGFYMYMIEQKPLYERKGRSFPGGLKEVATFLRSDWNRLTPVERAHYDKLAKAEKEKANASYKGKLTSDGRLITEVMAKESDQKNRFKNMVSAIQNWIQRLSAEEAIEENFYLISFNINCQILSDDKTDEEGELIPNEVGMVEYSIKSGIKRWYHTFIHPGKLPMGYAFYAQEHSQSTHKISIYGHEKSNDNYPAIWIHLKNFINPSESKSAYPPVFAMTSQMTQTRNCLNWLHQRSCDSRKNMFRVYDLTYLLVELRMKGGQPVAAVSEAMNLLSGSTFQYMANTCCEWHEEIDCQYCPLGETKLLAYHLSDALCHLFQVEVTKSHLPESTDCQSITVGGNLPTHDYKLSQSSFKATKNSPEDLNKPSSSGTYQSSGFLEEQFQDFEDQLSESASQSNENYTPDYSPPSQYSEMENLATGFSEASIKDFEQLDNIEDEDEDWIPVGRASNRRKNKPTYPQEIGAGRGLFNRK